MRALLFIAFISTTALAVDPEIMRLSQAFKAAVDKYSPLDLSGGSVIKEELFVVNFVPLVGIHGRCYLKTHPARIELDSNTWAKLSPDKKEAVFFHELAHCLIGRGHRNDLVKGQPISIMHERGVKADQYKMNRDYYLEELFFHKE